ncbi:unnamed protein product, partial [Symbiodinium sp. KB8]
YVTAAHHDDDNDGAIMMILMPFSSSDPRFDDMYGKINRHVYNIQYGFLDEYKKDEIEDLATKVKKTKNKKEARHLRQQLQQMKGEYTVKKRGDRVAERVQAMLEEEKSKVESGVKSAWHLNKRTIREIENEEKFKDLKAGGGKQLERYLAKKRQRVAAKERKKLPFDTRHG